MRKTLLTAATIGAAAAGLELFNRRVTMPRAALEPQLPATPTMWRWRQGEIAVYEAGDPSNQPLLMLHGQNAAASAAEMREPFARLSNSFHVFVPDLLGYGCSDRPDAPYAPELHIELIEDLLREVVKRPANVLASSLTSAYAIEVAANNPEWITRLVLICPTGLRRLTKQSPLGKVLEALFRVPVLGQGMFYGIASRASIAYFLKAQTYRNPDVVTDEMLDRYYRTSHVPGAQYAPAAFVSGKLYHDCSDAWTRLEQNALIVWGREATFTPSSDSATFLATNAGAQLEIIDNASVLPHDEQPEEFANLVGSWLANSSG